MARCGKRLPNAQTIPSSSFGVLIGALHPELTTLPQPMWPASLLARGSWNAYLTTQVISLPLLKKSQSSIPSVVTPEIDYLSCLSPAALLSQRLLPKPSLFIYYLSALRRPVFQVDCKKRQPTRSAQPYRFLEGIGVQTSICQVLG